MRTITVLCALAFILLVASLALAQEHGHVIGTVAAVAADKLVVTTDEGNKVDLPINQETQFFKGEEKASWKDVKVGDRLVSRLGDKGVAAVVRFSAASEHHGHPGN